jgi:hypothetical protein
LSGVAGVSWAAGDPDAQCCVFVCVCVCVCVWAHPSPARNIAALTPQTWLKPPQPRNQSTYIHTCNQPAAATHRTRGSAPTSAAIAVRGSKTCWGSCSTAAGHRRVRGATCRPACTRARQVGWPDGPCACTHCAHTARAPTYPTPH